jgi:glyoxylase-like metal-dependent hydrolase (beta-lactamase superfamily II)
MDFADRLKIPTPFNVGRVNCYVLINRGLTVIDPGPATQTAYDELAAGLGALGFAIADVETVLITHPHMDHFGLANRVVSESRARTVAHEDAARRLGDPIGHLDREQALFRPLMRTMGVPEQTIETAITLPEAFTEYQEPLAVDHELVDGDRIDAGTELTALHTPGHAPGSVCFLSAPESVAFTGDHVLSHISPNPLLTVVPGAEARRTRSLPTYLDSLKRLEAAGVEVGHPGHGDVVHDLNGRIDEIVAHHHERKEHIATIVRERGSVTPFEVMQEIFPDLPATEAFPGISEVLGHLDLLEDDGRVAITHVDGLSEYTLG